MYYTMYYTLFFISMLYIRLQYLIFIIIKNITITNISGNNETDVLR